MRHAILKTDKYRPIKVSNNKIYVDGLFRSDVDPMYVGNGLNAPSTCLNIAPKWWDDKSWTCTSHPWEVERECTKDDVWTQDEYCRQTCFDLGLRYEGDDCSPGWPSFSYDGYVCDVRQDEVGSYVFLGTSSSCGGSKTEAWIET